MEPISIKAARINKELTISDVSKEIGVSEITISKWENYITFPDAIHFQQLCRLYGLKMDDIFVPDKLAKS